MLLLLFVLLVFMFTYPDVMLLKLKKHHYKSCSITQELTKRTDGEYKELPVKREASAPSLLCAFYCLAAFFQFVMKHLMFSFAAEEERAGLPGERTEQLSIDKPALINLVCLREQNNFVFRV